MNAPALIRPTIKLHTIDEWMRLDPLIKVEVLKGIKLKDRLHTWLTNRQKEVLTAPKWVPCRKCNGLGHVLMEPRYDGIHPSRVPSPCLLQIYHEMVGNVVPQKFEARMLLVFDLGTAVHKMFQGYGKGGAWGPFYRDEAPISSEFQPLADELMLEGSADAENLLVIDDIPNAPIYEVGLVHEYKTIHKDGFAKLTRPKPEHKTQAMIYAAALNRPIVVYMYLNKNDSTLADFPVPFEPNLWEPIRKKAETLVQYYQQSEQAQAKGLPQVPPPAEPGFHCNDCGHRQNCAAFKAHATKRKA
jgi:hypothetical protein